MGEKTFLQEANELNDSIIGGKISEGFNLDSSSTDIDKLLAQDKFDKGLVKKQGRMIPTVSSSVAIGRTAAQRFLGNVEDRSATGEIPISYDIDKYKDYLGSAIDPQGDLDELRARAQSTAEKWRYGATKFIGKTVTAAIGGTAGTVYGAVKALSEGDLTKYYDNALQHTLDSWGEAMDEALPNYYTKEEMDDNFFQSMGNANFWANDVLSGLSFTAGAVLTELAWTAASAATFGALAPVQAAGTLTLVPRVLRYLKLASKAGKIGDRLLEASIARKFLDAGQLTRSFFTGAGFEASVEANAFMKDSMTAFEKDYLTKHPEAEVVPPNELAKFRDKLVQSANGVWAANLAVVGIGNLVAFQRIFGRGLKSFIPNAGKVGLTSSGVAESLVEPVSKMHNIGIRAYKMSKTAMVEGLWEEGIQNVIRNSGMTYMSHKYNPSAIDDTVNLWSIVGDEFAKNYDPINGDKEGWKQMGIGMIIGFMGLPNIHAFGKIGSKEAGYKFGRVIDQPIWSGGAYGELLEFNKKRAETKATANRVNETTTALFNEIEKNQPELFSRLSDKIKSGARQVALVKELDKYIDNDDLVNQKRLGDDLMHNFLVARYDAGLLGDTISEMTEIIDKLSINELRDIFTPQGSTLSVSDEDLKKDINFRKEWFKDKVKYFNLAMRDVNSVMPNESKEIKELLGYHSFTGRSLDSYIKYSKEDLSQLTSQDYIPNDSQSRKEVLDDINTKHKIGEEAVEAKSKAVELMDDLDSMTTRKIAAINDYNYLLTKKGKTEAYQAITDFMKLSNDIVNESLAAGTLSNKGVFESSDGKLFELDQYIVLDEMDENGKPVRNTYTFSKSGDKVNLDLITELDEDTGKHKTTTKHTFENEAEVKAFLINHYLSNTINIIPLPNLNARPLSEEEAAKYKSNIPDKGSTDRGSGAKHATDKSTAPATDDITDDETAYGQDSTKDFKRPIEFLYSGLIAASEVDLEKLKGTKQYEPNIRYRNFTHNVNIHDGTYSAYCCTMQKFKDRFGEYYTDEEVARWEKDSRNRMAKEFFNVAYYSQLSKKRRDEIDTYINKTLISVIQKQDGTSFRPVDQNGEFIDDNTVLEKGIFTMFRLPSELYASGKSATYETDTDKIKKARDQYIEFKKSIIDNGATNRVIYYKSTGIPNFNPKVDGEYQFSETGEADLQTVIRGNKDNWTVVVSQNKSIVVGGTRYRTADGITYIYNELDGNLYRMQSRKLNEADTNNVIELFKLFIAGSRFNINSNTVISEDVKVNNISPLAVIKQIIYFANKKEDAPTAKSYFDDSEESKRTPGGKVVLNGVSYNLVQLDDNNKIVLKDGKLQINKDFLNALKEELPNMWLQVDSIINKPAEKYFAYSAKGNKIVSKAYKSYKDYLIDDVLTTSIVPLSAEELGIVQFKNKYLVVEIEQEPQSGKLDASETTKTVNKAVNETQDNVDNAGASGGLYSSSELKSEGVPVENKTEEQLEADLFGGVEKKYNATTITTAQKKLLSTLGYDKKAIEMLSNNPDEVQRIINENTKENLRSRTGEAVEGLETREEVVVWLSENLPQIPTDKLESIREMSDAWGALVNGVIFLSDVAEVGTGYHEAFHGVSHMLLSKRQQKALYNEYRQLNNMPKLIDKEVEELLAEDFRDFMLGKPINYFKGEQTKNFFQFLWDLIKGIFASPNIETTFNRIKSGYYRSKAIKFSAQGITNKRSLRGKSEFYTAEAMKSLDFLLFKQLRGLEGGVSKLFAGGVDSKELYSTMQKDITTIVNKLDTLITTVKDQNKLDLYKDYRRNLQFLLDNWYFADGLSGKEAIEKSVVHIHSRHLADYNLNVELMTNMDKDELDKDTPDSTKDWHYDNMKISAQQNATREIKLIMAMLPAEYIDRYEKKAKPKFTIFGIQSVMPAGQTFAIVSNLLANTTTIEDQTTKLEESIDTIPSVHALLEQLDMGSKSYNTKSFEQVRNILAFHQTFKKYRHSLFHSLIDSDGEFIRQDTTFQARYKKVVDRWGSVLTNNRNYVKVKSSKVLVYSDSFIEKLPESTEVLNTKHALNFLRTIGITFSEVNYDLLNNTDPIQSNTEIGKILPNRELKDTLVSKTRFILRGIKKGEISNIFSELENEKGSKEDLEFLVNVELNSSTDYVENSTRNINGDFIYLNSLYGQATYILSIISGNNIKTKDDLFERLPYLKSTWSRNSAWLNKLFDENGNRIKDVTIDLSLFDGSSRPGERSSKSFNKFNPVERLVSRINNTLLGSNPLQRPADNKVERNIDIKIKGKTTILVDFNSVINEDYLSIFKGYLIDELQYLIDLEAETVGVANISKVLDHGIILDLFDDNDRLAIIADARKNGAEEAVESVWGENGIAKEQIKSFIDEKAFGGDNLDNTTNILATLQGYNILVKSEKGFDNNGVVNVLGNEVSETLSVEDAKLIAKIYVINQAISSIEQAKLITGHPGWYNTLDDFFKRMSGYTGTKKYPTIDPRIDSWMDSLTNTLAIYLDRLPWRLTKNTTFNGKPILRSLVYEEPFVKSQYIEAWRKIITDNKIAELKRTPLTDEQVEKLSGKKLEELTTEEIITIKDKYYLDKASTHAGDILEAYTSISESDGQCIISLDAYRDLHIRIGSWTINHEATFLKEYGATHFPDIPLYGQYAGQEITDNMLTILDPAKPQYCGALAKDGFFPALYKMSFYPLTPSLVAASEQLAGSRTNLTKLSEHMIDESIDLVTFTSAVKVGASTKEDGIFNQQYGEDGLLNISEDNVMQYLYMEYLGIQLDTGNEVKEIVTDGSQQAKQMLNSIAGNGEFISLSLADKEVSSELTKQVFIEFVTTARRRMELGKNIFIKRFGLIEIDDGRYSIGTRQDENGDYVQDKVAIEKFVNRLEREARSKQLPDHIIRGIELLREEIHHGIDTIVNSKRIEGALVALGDKMTLRPKRFGRQLYDISSSMFELESQSRIDKDGIMVSDLLKSYRDENGRITSMEVLVPDYFSIDLNQQIRIEDIKDERLRKAVMFRIPTGGLNCIESVIVKGFLPKSSGNAIITPVETIVTQGKDFDFDKQFLYFPNFFYDESGQPVFIESTDIDKQYTKYVKATKGRLLLELDKLTNDILTSLPATRDRYLKDLVRDLKSDISTEETLKNLQTNVDADISRLVSLLKEGISIIEKDAANTDLAILIRFSDKLGMISEKPELLDSIGRNTAILSKDSFERLALENKMLTIESELLTAKERFDQLVVPTRSSTIKDAVTKVNELDKDLDTKVDDKGFANLIDPKYLLKKENDLLGLQAMVGISALQSSSNIDSQLINYIFKDDIEYQIGSATPITAPTSILLEGSSDGTLGTIYNNDGQAISDILNQIMQAIIDGAKDSYFMSSNIRDTNLGTVEVLLRSGVTPYTVMLFMKQPIIKDYLINEIKYNNEFARANGTSKSRYKIYTDTLAKYKNKKAPKTDEGKEHKFTNTELEEFIKNKKSLTEQDKAEQEKVLKEYVKYLELARRMLAHMSSTTYDTKGAGTDISSLTYRTLSTEMLIKPESRQTLISNFKDSFAPNSFFGMYYDMAKQMIGVHKAVTITAASEGISNRVTDLARTLLNETEVARIVKEDDAVKLLSRLKTAALSYIATNYEYTVNKTTYPAIKTEARRLMTGDDSIPKQIAAIRKGLMYPDLFDNQFILSIISITSDEMDNAKFEQLRYETDMVNQIVNDWYAIFDAQPEFAIDLVKFAILQTGLHSSVMNLSSFIPAEIFTQIMSSTLTQAKQDPSNDFSNFYVDFFLNNYMDDTLVPRITGMRNYKNISKAYPLIKMGIVNEEHAKRLKQYISEGKSEKEARRLLSKKGIPYFSKDTAFVMINPNYEGSTEFSGYEVVKDGKTVTQVETRGTTNTNDGKYFVEYGVPYSMLAQNNIEDRADKIPVYQGGENIIPTAEEGGQLSLDFGEARPIVETTTEKKIGEEISSNTKGLAAALTNPTELSKKKGNIKQPYPVTFEDKEYVDAEAAYQANKKSYPTRGEDAGSTYTLMTKILTAKLEQYPQLVKAITENGGSEYILKSTHQPTNKNTVWETGGQNWFIKALNTAYANVLNKQIQNRKADGLAQMKEGLWDAVIEEKGLVKDDLIKELTDAKTSEDVANILKKIC